MKRLAPAALLFALAVPASAQDFGSLWTLPCGQQGAHQEESQLNRIRNMAGASNLVRVAFQVDGPEFDPDATNILLQCHTNREILQWTKAEGFRLFVVSTLHDPGAPNGYNYHNAKNASSGPILDAGLIRDWWISFIGFLDENYAGIRQLGTNGVGIQYAAVGNELGYCPHDCPSRDDLLDAYMDIMTEVMPIWPSSWVRVDGGIFGRMEEADPSWANQRNIAASLHCNGDSNAQCREELEALAGDYHAVFIDEDWSPIGSTVLERYQVCESVPECIGLITMYARSSGNPPEETCCWGVGGCTKVRGHIAVEGCGYVWQDGTGEPGQVGGYTHYQEFNEAGIYAGTAIAGFDFDALPNTIEGEEPPPEPVECEDIPSQIESASCLLDECRDTGDQKLCNQAIRKLTNWHLAN